jgi:hypothetical protein
MSTWKKVAIGFVVLVVIGKCAGPTDSQTKSVVKPTVTISSEEIIAPAVTETPTKAIVIEATASPTETEIVPTATVEIESTVEPTVSQAQTNTSTDSYPCKIGEIKGNFESKKYHLPGWRFYPQSKNVFCFASEQDAINAGYVASKVK